MSAREYEGALEDEIMTRLNALEELYTSHCRLEGQSMREKYLDDSQLGTPRQLQIESAVAVPLLSLPLLQSKLSEWKLRYKPAPRLGEQPQPQQQNQQQHCGQQEQVASS